MKKKESDYCKLFSKQAKKNPTKIYDKLRTEIYIRLRIDTKAEVLKKIIQTIAATTKE